jgi:hypothetical protein
MLNLIANWWNWVYLDLMGGSILLMLLFGWELFMIPIGLAFMGIVMCLALVGSLFKSK